MRVASDVSPVSPFCFTVTMMHSPRFGLCLCFVFACLVLRGFVLFAFFVGAFVLRVHQGFKFHLPRMF